MPMDLDVIESIGLCLLVNIVFWLAGFALIVAESAEKKEQNKNIGRIKWRRPIIILVLSILASVVFGCIVFFEFASIRTPENSYVSSGEASFFIAEAIYLCLWALAFKWMMARQCASRWEGWLTFCAISACIVIMPAYSYVRAENLTRMHASELYSVPVPTEWGGADKYEVFKVLGYTHSEATVYAADCERDESGRLICYGHSFVYEKKDGRWKCRGGAEMRDETITWPPF